MLKQSQHMGLLLLMLLWCVSIPTIAQSDDTSQATEQDIIPLEPNPVGWMVGESQAVGNPTFSVDLEADSVFMVWAQLYVDVCIRVTAPSGEELVELNRYPTLFDSGEVTFITPETGTYLVTLGTLFGCSPIEEYQAERTLQVAVVPLTFLEAQDDSIQPLTDIPQQSTAGIYANPSQMTLEEGSRYRLSITTETPLEDILVVHVVQNGQNYDDGILFTLNDVTEGSIVFEADTTGVGFVEIYLRHQNPAESDLEDVPFTISLETLENDQ